MTNGVEVKESRVSRLGVPQRIMLLTASVAAIAVALFVIVVRTLPGAPTALTLPWVLWAAAFAVAVALVVHRRQRGIKLAFNLAISALGGSLATIVFAILSGPVGLWDWVAALVAVLVITVTADLAIFAVISLSEGLAHLAPLLEMLALSLPF